MSSVPDASPVRSLGPGAAVAGRPVGAFRLLLRDPMGAAGLLLVVLFLGMAIFAPWIAPYDPLKLDVPARFSLPSWQHWAGADQLGRDLLSRIVWGARIALGIAVGATLTAGAIGLFLGLVAGFGPRWLDAILVLMFDSVNSLPMIMFALAVITVLGPGIETLVLVIVAVSIPGYARLIRAQTLALKSADFIEAERTMGASGARILFVHLLPNVIGPLVILLSMDIPVVIMLEAGLSYLSLGVRPPNPSWGNILYDGYTSLRDAPHIVIAAGIPLILCTLGFTFLGEALRDALDPRLRGEVGAVSLLSVEDLRVSYRGGAQALRGVTLEADHGEVLGIVGESGCGKSTLAAALIGLLPDGARIDGGRVRLDGVDLMALSDRERRRMRGPGIAAIFQDPMTAFSPVLRLGEQLVDFQYNLPLPRRDKRARAEEMLARVGIADPAACRARYPHELSGGMRQRAAVAAALLMSPQVLVADEPTTALDVTMEAQILHLLRGLRAETRGAIVVITHHLGVVGELCDRVAVMYAGQIVEEGTVDEVHHAPRHPYTQALLACDPGSLEDRVAVLPTIPGRPPDLADPPPGCGFAARCPRACDRCHQVPPPRVRLSASRSVLCHRVTA